MVQSASSSNTQWPSGRWRCSSASVAAWMARSSAATFGVVSGDIQVSAVSVARFLRDQIPPRAAPNGSLPRWSPAVRSRSNRRRGRGCESAWPCRAVWHFLPAWRQRSPAVPARFATGAVHPQCPRFARHPARSGPPAPREGMFEQPVGAADGDRQPAGEGEQPFHRAADDAGDRRQARSADRS